MGLKQREQKTYANILQSDGTIRVVVDKDTPGAVLRSYELKDGTKGEKWEKVYHELSGKIKDISFFDGEYGKTIQLVIVDDEEIILSVGLASNYADDIMKKLPNVKLKEEITIKPHSFKSKKSGKLVRGVNIFQGDSKLFSYFHDEQKNPINGYPAPTEVIKKEQDKFDSDDWKDYFRVCNKFLKNYIGENILPGMSSLNNFIESVDGKEVDEDEINVDDIPFDK